MLQTKPSLGLNFILTIENARRIYDNEKDINGGEFSNSGGTNRIFRDPIPFGRWREKFNLPLISRLTPRFLEETINLNTKRDLRE